MNKIVTYLFPMNGIYPEHPVRDAIFNVVVFEIIIILLECAVVSWYIGKRAEEGFKDMKDLQVTIWVIVAISNILTFFLGIVLAVWLSA